MHRLAWAFVGRLCNMNLPFWGDKQAYFAWTFSKSLLHISEQQRHWRDLLGQQTGIFCLNFLSLYNISANSKGTGETTLMRRLAWAFVGRLCNRKLPYWGDKQAYFAWTFSVSTTYQRAAKALARLRLCVGTPEPLLVAYVIWTSPIGATNRHILPELSQSLYYISANSKGSGETTLMRRLAWAFVGRLCNMNLAYWSDKQAYFFWTFSKSLLHISEQQRHWQDYAYA